VLDVLDCLGDYSPRQRFPRERHPTQAGWWRLQAVSSSASDRNLSSSGHLHQHHTTCCIRRQGAADSIVAAYLRPRTLESQYRLTLYYDARIVQPPQTRPLTVSIRECGALGAGLVEPLENGRIPGTARFRRELILPVTSSLSLAGLFTPARYTYSPVPATPIPRPSIN
jgi:hypothetical protein